MPTIPTRDDTEPVRVNRRHPIEVDRFALDTITTRRAPRLALILGALDDTAAQR